MEANAQTGNLSIRMWLSEDSYIYLKNLSNCISCNYPVSFYFEMLTAVVIKMCGFFCLHLCSQIFWYEDTSENRFLKFHNNYPDMRVGANHVRSTTGGSGV
jgi:hypothetical protein